MPRYINPGQFIEPYLKPYGKQTIEQIPGIQTRQLAKERLGALKPVWAEQVAESQANREIQRQAQERWGELQNLPKEAFKGMIPEGMDVETALNAVRAGLIKMPTPAHKEDLPPAWKEVEYINEQGQRVKKHINVNDPTQQREFVVPTQKVKIGNKTFDVPIEAANALEAYRMKQVADDQEWQRERDEKRRKEDIKFLEDRMEDAIAIGPAGQEMLTIYTQQLAEIVGQSTSGMARDPEIDKARAIIMEANQQLQRYAKMPSDDPADMGALPVQGVGQQPVPMRQMLMPPPKKEPKGPKEPTFTEERMSAKDAAKAEEAIVSPENEGNPALVGPISIFNRFSNKPYVYIWKIEKQKKGSLWWKKDVEVGKTQKIDLPVVNGKQVTAKEVWFTAQENGITMMEVLKLIGAIE